ncbi:unnamed protein product [Toxocara canis]|uniref:DDE_Tnp_1_7 domain-containing protein n=1 Tax=Toxocara canis TaxID=6265 RepID=A0A183VG00_TOXCA|nr:unnamed protein product [Toxocara canis]
MSIAHTIGDRTHAIEKRRDRDGRIREQQRFINLRQGFCLILNAVCVVRMGSLIERHNFWLPNFLSAGYEAVEFDREFTSRVRRSLGGGSVRQQRAIEYVAGSASAGHAMGTGRSNAQAKDMSNAPVVTMPDDEKSDLYDSSHHAHSFRKHGDARAPRVGPIIKEVHDEEIRTDERRHKKCMRGRFSNARND